MVDEVTSITRWVADSDRDPAEIAALDVPVLWTDDEQRAAYEDEGIDGFELRFESSETSAVIGWCSESLRRFVEHGEDAYIIGRVGKWHIWTVGDRRFAEDEPDIDHQGLKDVVALQDAEAALEARRELVADADRIRIDTWDGRELWARTELQGPVAVGRISFVPDRGGPMLVVDARNLGTDERELVAEVLAYDHSDNPVERGDDMLPVVPPRGRGVLKVRVEREPQIAYFDLFVRAEAY